jgi:hypothetical protein
MSAAPRAESDNSAVRSGVLAFTFGGFQLIPSPDGDGSPRPTVADCRCAAGRANYWAWKTPVGQGARPGCAWYVPVDHEAPGRTRMVPAMVRAPLF